METNEDRDEYMAGMFINAYGDGNYGKAIIHTGFNHSFFDLQGYGKRMGDYLNQKYGDKLFQICLHHNYDTGNAKVNKEDFYISKFIDDVYHGNGNKHIGFDIVGSPFKNMRDSVSDFFVYNDYTVLGTVTEGYIVFKAASDIKNTHFIDNFIDKSNFEKAKEIIKTRGWFKFEDDISIDELNRKLSSYMNSF